MSKLSGEAKDISAEDGMKEGIASGRKRKPPPSFMDDVEKLEEKKLILRAKNRIQRNIKSSKANGKAPAAKAKPTRKKTAAPKAVSNKRKAIDMSNRRTTGRKKKPVSLDAPVAAKTQEKKVEPMSLYERHRREFERIVTRLEKIDRFAYFLDVDDPDCPVQLTPVATAKAAAVQAPVNDETKSGSGGVATGNGVALVTREQGPSVEQGQQLPIAMQLDNTQMKEGTNESVSVAVALPVPSSQAVSGTAIGSVNTTLQSLNPVTAKPKPSPKKTESDFPRTWNEVRQRIQARRYVLNREWIEEKRRFRELGPYYASIGKKHPRSNFYADGTRRKSVKSSARVLNPNGVHWDRFLADIIGMCDQALAENTSDDTSRSSLYTAAHKIKEEVTKAYEKTGKRQLVDLDVADEKFKFNEMLKERSIYETVMQRWRQTPFPERKYERLATDAFCEGLSPVDEGVAKYELQTTSKDKFVGISYQYDDTGQSEAWMKSLVDESGVTASGGEVRKAALAMAADDGMRRAQVVTTMECLLIKVQDKVMTDLNVLQQEELRSANWIGEKPVLPSSPGPSTQDTSMESELVEQPVWGIDCYTRRNVQLCLMATFDEKTALTFIEKWLLPAINACPVQFAPELSNATRLLEGLPFVKKESPELDDCTSTEDSRGSDSWSQTLLGKALHKKIETEAPPWLKAAATEVRRARKVLGPDLFRVHPKGHGSVMLRPIEANRLVTYYRGELYPSWRWGEKTDAIELTQKRKALKPALPDFYNMALERPQADPRGYGLLFVDASRKAGHGSSLSHSCDPTCQVRVAAKDGELCLAMTTLRELEMGEELTFDYHAVTESLNEFQAGVCLCGYGNCRGSFLHYATADCYQEVLNRNAPIATRFSNLVKGCMKQVMSDDDKKVLQNHGFHTAAFGAISVDRHGLHRIDNGTTQSSLSDLIEIVPVWLRTFVADTLRYIEYERRALPISLICSHITATQKVKEESEQGGTKKEKEEKPPGKEPPFFYFSRVERDFLITLVPDEELPNNTTGLAMKNVMLKTASAYWEKVPAEKKEYWKGRSEAAHKKKVQEWRARKNKEKRAAKKGNAKNKAPGMKDVLSSKVSFQAADNEGFLAMEQRIQQLTQALSRVGRVLDRHREAVLSNTEENLTSQKMQELVHSPLSMLSDAETIGWLWKSKSGPVSSLFRVLEDSKMVRPSLMPTLQEVKTKYAFLDRFPDPTIDEPHEKNSDAQGAEGRVELKKALLQFRKVLIEELKSMGRDMRAAMKADSNQVDATGAEISALLQEMVSKVEERVSDVKDSSPTGNEAQDLSEPPEWMNHFHERYKLFAIADTLLLYAETKTFFVMKAYEQFDSTPIEVFARELGNAVPRSVMDDTERNEAEPIEVSTHSVPLETPKKRSRKKKVDTAQEVPLCAPDDIVARVTISYAGGYILSQLLQWYNGGIGQQEGLPDLLGCTALPTVEGCWSSALGDADAKSESKMKKPRKTPYETVVRPKLVRWLQDPYQRGNPWSEDIRKGFEPVGDALLKLQDSNSSFVAFGSPVTDFLITGDESSIHDVLHALDADDRIAGDARNEGVLASVDRGRPAQAISTWVQCENEKCLKWRKIPWHVDVDLLPKKFFCKDNKWNPAANSCECPEDEWDFNDSLVDENGKVEGSPMRKRKRGTASPLDEKSFRDGARFDVKRTGCDQYGIGVVKRIDFSGKIKRILFRFPGVPDAEDEWIEFGSDRIARLNTKAPMPQGKAKSEEPKQKELRAEEDPYKIDNFVPGARFDVIRTGRTKHSRGIVVKVDKTAVIPRILFHFVKTHDKDNEWVDFGSDRIARPETKVPKKRHKPKKQPLLPSQFLAQKPLAVPPTALSPVKASSAEAMDLLADLAVAVQTNEQVEKRSNPEHFLAPHNRPVGQVHAVVDRRPDPRSLNADVLLPTAAHQHSSSSYPMMAAMNAWPFGTTNPYAAATNGLPNYMPWPPPSSLSLLQQQQQHPQLVREHEALRNDLPPNPPHPPAGNPFNM